MASVTFPIEEMFGVLLTVNKENKKRIKGTRIRLPRAFNGR